MQFVTQNNQAYCGGCQHSYGANVLSISAPVALEYSPYHVFTQDNFFNNEQTKKVLSPEVVSRQGMTLDQLGQLLGSYPVKLISKPRLPDGPQAPKWLQKIQYTWRPFAYMDATQRYGDIFNAPVIGNHAVVLFISNPQALQRIFTNDMRQFIVPPNQLMQPLVGDYSIFTLAGSRHRRERRLLMPQQPTAVTLLGLHLVVKNSY
jgi:hypothetical protein